MKKDTLKVGDRVVVTGTQSSIMFFKDTGKIIVGRGASDSLGIEFDNQVSQCLHNCNDNGKEDHCYWVDKDLIELEGDKFKANDRVVVTGDQYGMIFDDNHGKVLSIEWGGSYIAVEFDTTFNDSLHSCGDKGKEEHCYYVKTDIVDVQFEEDEEVIEMKKDSIEIGDMVIVDVHKTFISSEERFGHTNKYENGVVLRDSEDGHTLAVEFLNHMKGHGCKGKGKEGYCFYVKPEYITKVIKKDLSLILDKPQQITSYEFRGKYSMELLCREAFKEGIAAFLVIERGDVGASGKGRVLAVVNSSIDFDYGYIESSFGYKVYPFGVNRTSSLISDIKGINEDFEVRLQELKQKAFEVEDKGDYKNKVMYIK